MSHNDTPPFIPANLPKRIMALSYDIFIIAALSMAYWGIATAIMANLSPAATAHNYMPMQKGQGANLGWLASIAVFYWFFWKRAGQTVGMRAWRLRVISRDGAPLRHWQCLVRIMVGPLALGLGALGYLWCFTNRDRLAWQDLASSSRVVYEPKPKKAEKQSKPGA